ncbi:MAG: alpha/beta hydrolase [Bacteroidetes bacterium]|nr:alpha/beta hydrolase [Bacteroidota bacterium]
MKKLILAALVVCGLAAVAQSIEGTKPFELGVIDHVKSDIPGQSRDLNIYLPKGYTPQKQWPVIYLLDGGRNEDFIHISGIVQFFTEIVDTMPEAIIVGICNVDRKRDFTFAPGSTEEFRKMIPNAGGSKGFITFLEKDLRPYIQKKYNGKGTSTLIGQSAAGLLATEVLLAHTGLFDNYLIVSPSLWWNDEALLKIKPGTLKESKNKKVFLAIGNEGDQSMRDSKMLLEIIKSPDIKVAFLHMPQETHLTILHNAAYKGLLHLLARSAKKD